MMDSSGVDNVLSLSRGLKLHATTAVEEHKKVSNVNVHNVHNNRPSGSEMAKGKNCHGANDQR